MTKFRKKNNKQHSVKILVSYTPNFQQLFDNLKSSLKNERTIILHEKRVDFEKKYDIFRFRSESWYKAIEYQYENAVKFIDEEVKDGEYFIISDVDVHFLQPHKIIDLVNDVLIGNYDIAGEHEGNKNLNSGFIIAKKNPKIVKIYNDVLSNLKKRKKELADQTEINILIRERECKIKYVDENLIGMGGRKQLKKSMILFHFINTGDLQAKIRMMNRIKNEHKELLLESIKK